MAPFHKPHPRLLCPMVRGSAVTVWDVLRAKKKSYKLKTSIISYNSGHDQTV